MCKERGAADLRIALLVLFTNLHLQIYGSGQHERSGHPGMQGITGERPVFFIKHIVDHEVKRYRRLVHGRFISGTEVKGKVGGDAELFVFDIRAAYIVEARQYRKGIVCPVLVPPQFCATGVMPPCSWHRLA